MKRISFPLILCVLLSFLVVPCLAERTYLSDFDHAVNELAGTKGSVISSSQWGKSGAAIIEMDGSCTLYMLCLENMAWSVQFANETAVCNRSNVYLDAEDLLILTNPSNPYEEYHEQFYFTLEDKDWLLSFVIRYEGNEEEGCLTEYLAEVDGGLLNTTACLTDLEGNVQVTYDGGTLPNVLTRDELNLVAFDGAEPAFNGCGYLRDESLSISREMIRRLFESIISDDYTLVDGILSEDGLQFIADKPDGTRVLLCCNDTDPSDELQMQVTESSPLPPGTTMGIENFENFLNLSGQAYGVSIGLYPNGHWAVTGFILQNCEQLTAGADYVSEDMTLESLIIGSHPWNDVSTMDWASIPRNRTEVVRSMNTTLWATPNNPNPKDRLHLRVEPTKNSKSLGKYYNGTPIRVTSYDREWTLVYIGGQVGYMKTQFLAFGNDVNNIKSAILQKEAVYPLTQVYWNNESEPSLLTREQVRRLFIIGVHQDEWYLVWEPATGRYGRVRQIDLQDGNG